MLARRNRFGRLGAEAPTGEQKAAGVAKGAAGGAAAGTASGGVVGTVVGAVAGALGSVFKMVGLGKKARAGRLDSQTQLVKWQAAANTINKETQQFKGTQLPDPAFQDFLNMAIDINNGKEIAAAGYRQAAGL